jgi:hypothetical protein
MVIVETATGPYPEPDESSRLPLSLPIDLCIRCFPTKILVETEIPRSLYFS